MTLTLTELASSISAKFGEKISCSLEYAELNIEVTAVDLLSICAVLKAPPYEFFQLIDLAGIDHLQYDRKLGRARFAVVYHLLSQKNNLRVRIKSYCLESSAYCTACKEIISSAICSKCGALAPHLPSVVNLWPVANWYEREAFDMFGIIFNGHPALTRILTEDDLQGHALRKDFPMVGKTEVYYDVASEEVKSKPVSIEDRTVIHKSGQHGGCMAKQR